jgi:carbamate kinase
MRIVVALGGNALLRRGEELDADTQRRNVAVAVDALADVARDHRLVVTHGNGPQVGLLALQAAAYTETSPYPLDILGAESEGMIGYLLEQGLGNAFERPVATLLTQVLVAVDDPAFAHPTKPIGPIYARAEAVRLADLRDWAIAPDGDHWRRVVPSPDPIQIVELKAIRLLVEAGVLVICTGGGGIPVVSDRYGALHGVEAVIDKDLAAALLASELDADALLMLTDVDAVYRRWGDRRAEPIASLAMEDARGLDLPDGSMGPKVRAAVRFAARSGRPAAIGALADTAAILEGRAGTWITPRHMSQAAGAGADGMPTVASP